MMVDRQEGTDIQRGNPKKQDFRIPSTKAIIGTNEK
jgi:hypothetical protein